MCRENRQVIGKDAPLLQQSSERVNRKSYKLTPHEATELLINSKGILVKQIYLHPRASTLCHFDRIRSLAAIGHRSISQHRRTEPQGQSAGEFTADKES